MTVKPTLRESLHRTLGGVCLRLCHWGSAPPRVLLVHGFAQNARVWDHLASTFDESCGVLAVDLRGHGGSDWDPTGTYAHAALVADVLHVLEEECPAPVVLVGHSLGAQIAIDVAAARRERVRALVLVDVAFKPQEHLTGYVRRQFRDRRRMYPKPADYVADLRTQLPIAREALLQALAEGALRVHPSGCWEERADPLLANMDDSIDEQAMRLALLQIARPILVVRGAASAVLSRAAARELLVGVPQSRLTVVTGAGHTVMLDNPDGFCAVVRPYILQFSTGPLCGATTGSSSPRTP